MSHIQNSIRNYFPVAFLHHYWCVSGSTVKKLVTVMIANSKIAAGLVKPESEHRGCGFDF